MGERSNGKFWYRSEIFKLHSTRLASNSGVGHAVARGTEKKGSGRMRVLSLHTILEKSRTRLS